MKALSSLLCAASTATLLASCGNGGCEFGEELKWIGPFVRESRAVYRSADGRVDTVVFSRVRAGMSEVRSIERGFYDECTLSVRYCVTPGSYHKHIRFPGADSCQRFVSFVSANGSLSNCEVYFLGLLFDDDYIDRVRGVSDTVVFNIKDAEYSNLNIDDGIKEFRFDFRLGIVSFVGMDGVAWVRDFSAEGNMK